jgi:hypothetical protein
MDASKDASMDSPIDSNLKVVSRDGPMDRPIVYDCLLTVNGQFTGHLRCPRTRNDF